MNIVLLVCALRGFRCARPASSMYEWDGIDGWSWPIVSGGIVVVEGVTNQMNLLLGFEDSIEFIGCYVERCAESGNTSTKAESKLRVTAVAFKDDLILASKWIERWEQPSEALLGKSRASILERYAFVNVRFGAHIAFAASAERRGLWASRSGVSRARLIGMTRSRPTRL